MWSLECCSFAFSGIKFWYCLVARGSSRSRWRDFCYVKLSNQRAILIRHDQSITLRHVVFENRDRTLRYLESLGPMYEYQIINNYVKKWRTRKLFRLENFSMQIQLILIAPSRNYKLAMRDGCICRLGESSPVSPQFFFHSGEFDKILSLNWNISLGVIFRRIPPSLGV